MVNRRRWLGRNCPPSIHDSTFTIHYSPFTIHDSPFTIPRYCGCRPPRPSRPAGRSAWNFFTWSCCSGVSSARTSARRCASRIAASVWAATEIRRGRADGAFVDRRCLDGGAPGVHRGTQPCLHLLGGLPPALRQLANLLALTIRQIELRQRQPELTRAAGTAESATASATGSSGTVSPLRERPTAREEAGDQHAGHQGTKSNHVNLHVSALLADVLLI